MTLHHPTAARFMIWRCMVHVACFVCKHCFSQVQWYRKKLYFLKKILFENFCKIHIWTLRCSLRVRIVRYMWDTNGCLHETWKTSKSGQKCVLSTFVDCWDDFWPKKNFQLFSSRKIFGSKIIFFEIWHPCTNMFFFWDVTFALVFSVEIRAARDGLNARNDAPGRIERDLQR